MASASCLVALNSRLSGTDELPLKTSQFKRICPTQACTTPARHNQDGRFPRRLLTGRAARPRHSARTRERRDVRANWPPLTRPTVRGLAVVCSSRRTQQDVENLACGASFGHEPETAIDHGEHWARLRAHSVCCRAAVRRAATRKNTTLLATAFATLRLATNVSPPSILYSPSGASAPRWLNGPLLAHRFLRTG